MADYNSKGKKPSQYKPPKADSSDRCDINPFGAKDRDINNRAAMARDRSREKLYQDVLNTQPEILMKELHIARKEIETLKNQLIVKERSVANYRLEAQKLRRENIE